MLVVFEFPLLTKPSAPAPHVTGSSVHVQMAGALQHERNETTLQVINQNPHNSGKEEDFTEGHTGLCSLTRRDVAISAARLVAVSLG
jgi:hypothetical protein